MDAYAAQESDFLTFSTQGNFQAVLENLWKFTSPILKLSAK